MGGSNVAHAIHNCGAAVNSAVRNRELCDCQRKRLLASQGFMLRGVTFCISTSPDTNVESNFSNKGPLYAGARHTSSLRLVSRVLLFHWDLQLPDSWSAVCESGRWNRNRRRACINFGELSVIFLNPKPVYPNIWLWRNRLSNFSYPEKCHLLQCLQARRNFINEGRRWNTAKLLLKEISL